MNRLFRKKLHGQKRNVVKFYLKTSLCIVLACSVIVIPTIFISRNKSISKPALAQANPACNSTKAASAYAASNVQVNGFQTNTTAESRFAVNSSTKTIQNVFLNSSNDIYFSGKSGVRPTLANLSETGYFADDSMIVTLKRTKDENGNTITPKYYTSYLLMFNMIDTYIVRSPNIPSILKQYALHDGKDNAVSGNTGYPDSHPPKNKVYFDNIVNSPVYQNGGSSYTNVYGSIYAKYAFYNNPTADAYPVGSLVRAGDLGYNTFYYEDSNGVSQQVNVSNTYIRKIGNEVNSGQHYAWFYDPTAQTYIAGLDDLQPQYFHQLPNYYKQIDNILDYANPSTAEYAQGGPILQPNQLPAGLYDVTIDILDTVQGNSVNFGVSDTGVYFNYTDQDQACILKPVYSNAQVTCTTATPYNPNSMTISINSAGMSGAQVNANHAVLTPSGSNYSFTYSGGTINTAAAPYAVVNKYPSPGAGVAGSYSVSNTSFTAGTTGNFTFTVTFDPSNAAFRQSYSTAGGMDLYLYVADNQGRNNLGAGNAVPKVDTKVFIPYQDCIRPYYSTSGGDFRSNETGAYVGKLGTNVVYGTNGNKYWQAQNAALTQYRAFDNFIPNYHPFTSSYLYEKQSSVTSGSTNNTSSFDKTVASDSYKPVLVSDVLDTFQSTLETAITDKTIKRVASTSLAYPALSTDVVTKTITLRLEHLPDETAVIDVDDNTGTYEKLVVEDNPTTSPTSLIIWCKLAKCQMQIKSIKTVPTLSLDSNSNVTYDKSGVTSLSAGKSRIFFNYFTGEQATTPVKTTQSYTDGGLNKSIPATRSIELTESNATAYNYYLGAMLTNGFVFTSKSSKTDIVKGLIMSRGVVANSTNAGVSNMYFKDFQNPFLFIDYDPKYFVNWANPLAGQNSLKTIKKIGI